MNESGTLIEASEAINYYISGGSHVVLNLELHDRKVFSEDVLIQILNEGNVVYIARGVYEITGTNYTRMGGHATVIYGYVKINGGYWFLIKDPDPVGEGSTKMMSYEKLYNGKDPQLWEAQDDSVWDGIIVVSDSDYATDMEPFYLDRVA